MTGIDAGRYAIDPATRRFLIEPWHLKHLGKRLAYDPVVSVKILDLSAADRYEIDRLSWEFADNDYSMRRMQPRFEHPGVAKIVSHDDFRPVLRLRYLNIRGMRNLDIARPDDRLSSFQRLHLAAVLKEPDPRWAHIAADAA